MLYNTKVRISIWFMIDSKQVKYSKKQKKVRIYLVVSKKSSTFAASIFTHYGEKTVLIASYRCFFAQRLCYVHLGFVADGL